MKTRPNIGARVRLPRAGFPRGSVGGKCGIVVAHHSDGVAIVVRVDPQTPLRPYRPDLARQFDQKSGGFSKTFRRREGDWVVDYPDVEEPK